MDKIKNKGESSTKIIDSKEIKHDISKKTSDKKSGGDSNARKYAALTSDFVNVIAESVGISDLSEDILAGLASDASYRLREVIHNCSVMLKNTKRRKLLTEDVSRVLEVSDCPPIYGHSSPGESGFTYVPEAEVYVADDVEIDIVAMATSNSSFTQKSDQFVKGQWVVLEPSDQAMDNKDNRQETGVNAKAGSSSDNSGPGQKPNKPPGKDDLPGASRPPPHLLNYYLQVAKAIIGGSTPLLQVALADLRTNPNISSICQYFLNLVALSVNKLHRHEWLTDSLLSTVQAIVENQYVDPSCYLAVNRAANSLLVIAVETKVAPNCDDLLLRTRAAHVLAKVFMNWTIELKQQMDIVRQLLTLLLDKNMSLHSQYGAISCLTSLGYGILSKYFWPVMGRYFPLLQERLPRCLPTEVVHVKGAILLAADRMYRKEWKSCIIEEVKWRVKVDHMLSEYLGEMLLPRRFEYNPGCSIYTKIPTTDSVGKGPSKEPCSLIMDHDFEKSWNPSYLIQRKPYQPKVRINFNPKRKVRNASDEPVFDTSEQLDYRRLKHRKLTLNHTWYQPAVHTLPALWKKQNIYKNTRNIKYCVQQHLKACSGDLYVIL